MILANLDTTMLLWTGIVLWRDIVSAWMILNFYVKSTRVLEGESGMKKMGGQ